MSKVDPDRVYFNERLAHTAQAKTFLRCWREQDSALKQIKLAVHYGVATDIAAARRIYMDANHRCSLALTALNATFNWPAY